MSVITPKSFRFSIVSSRCMELLSVVEYLISPTLFFPVVTFSFVGWNFSNHLLPHYSKVFRSCCKMPWSFLSITVLTILMSSANRNVSDLVSSGRSFIYSTNSNGHVTEPWGIPEVTLCHFDSFTFTATFCFLSVRYAPMQFIISFLML